MARPSGLDEANILTVNNSWVGTPDDLKARIATDLTALRALPGVVDAEATNGVPLSGLGGGTAISLQLAQNQQSAGTAQYFVDEHGLATYGIRLICIRVTMMSQPVS
jgi:putative ABC transport system permease protein